MIDERTRRMIEEYLPSPPDRSLGFMEYYYRQCTMGGERVIRVTVKNIFPSEQDDGLEYDIYQKKGSDYVRIDSGWNNPFRGVRMSDLYDNKEDCRNQTHPWADNWEELRQMQQEEAGK